MVGASIVKNLVKLWARSGKAPGWAYQFIEGNAHRLFTRTDLRRLHNGLLFECDIRDHIQQNIYFFGGYEPIETTLFLSLVRPGDTVVDAGANIGYYALNLSIRVGNAGRVLAFEPVPRNGAVFRRNLELNGNPSNIEWIRRALWNKEESLRFSLDPTQAQNPGSFTAARVAGVRAEVECEAVTLDSHLAAQGVSKISAIKMDIEGAEKFALEGAAKTLSRDRPVICLEVCRAHCERMGYSTPELWGLLKPYGYRIYHVRATREASGWISDFSGIVQSNVLLIPEGRVAEFDTAWNDKTIRRKFLGYS